MEVQDLEIRLHIDEVQEKPPELPRNVRAIQIGERTFLFKWTFTGWRQLTILERIDIHTRYGI